MNPWNPLKQPEDSKIFRALREPVGIWNPLIFPMDPLVTRTPTVISYAISFIELKIIMHSMNIVNYNLCSLLAVLQ